MKYLSLTESELTHFHFDTPIHTYVRIVLHEAIYIYIYVLLSYIYLALDNAQIGILISTEYIICI